MKKLLVIADKLGGKNIALQRALSLQVQTGAKITLMGFCYANIDNPDSLAFAKLSRSKLQRTLLANCKEQLTELVDGLGTKPSNIEIKATWSKDIGLAVCAYCKDQTVDLVLKSGHRSETFLYTPTDWELLRDCPSPVMITATKSWKKKACILAAVDFGSHVKSKINLNYKIIQQAQALAHDLGKELHIAYSLTTPTVLADMDLIDIKQYTKEKRKKLQPSIDKFCEQYSIDKDRVHIRQGKADKIIPSIASKLKADVVITGTVGRKGIKGKVMGNTAEGILSRLRTDIIVIKP